MRITDRSLLHAATRIVVKVGSQALIQHPTLVSELTKQIATLHQQGKEVILVTSGAVAVGREELGMEERPSELHKLQAVAALGQSRLMRRYEEAFREQDLLAAQVLVTHENLANREQYLNVQGTLQELFSFGVIPVVNENDTMATDELRLGDNDGLASMIAVLMHADALVLLTNVDGLLDGEGNRVPNVTQVEDVEHLVQSGKSSFGLGGMSSKLLAAHRAMKHGSAVLIANAAESQILEKVFKGESVGSFFSPYSQQLASRKHWIAFTLKVKGSLTVDNGAALALTSKKKSLLPPGIVTVQGTFDSGDMVSIQNQDKQELARGLVRYSSDELPRICGKRTSEIQDILGYAGDHTVIHRDDMVMLDDSY